MLVSCPQVDDALKEDSFLQSLRARIDAERAKLFDSMYAEVQAEVESKRAERRAEVIARLEEVSACIARHVRHFGTSSSNGALRHVDERCAASCGRDL